MSHPLNVLDLTRYVLADEDGYQTLMRISKVKGKPESVVDCPFECPSVQGGKKDGRAGSRAAREKKKSNMFMFEFANMP